MDLIQLVNHIPGRDVGLNRQTLDARDAISRVILRGLDKWRFCTLVLPWGLSIKLADSYTSIS
jgi:hypothetical protein